MENTNLLQSYLDAGLFEIGDNDDRLANLNAAVVDFIQQLKDNPSLVPKFTIAAFDPDIPADDPALIEVETLVKNRWSLLRSKFHEIPKVPLRGVMLSALYRVGSEDPNLSRVVCLTAKHNSRTRSSGAQKPILETVLSELNQIAEDYAISMWSLNGESPALKLPTLKLADSIELATLKTTVEAPINKFFGDFKKGLDTTVKSAFTSTSIVEQRSKLLWWKETMYSQSFNESYRQLEDITPIVIAIDLSRLLPGTTPVSVDYFLTEVIESTLSLTGEIKLSDLVKVMLKQTNREALRPYFDSFVDYGGRMPLVNFLGLLVQDKVQLKSLNERTTWSEKDLLTPTDIALGFMHAFLVLKILNK